jgi:ankyrin repeat protein
MSDAAALIEAIKTADDEKARSILRENPRVATERLPSGESGLMTALYRGQGDLAAEMARAAGDLDVFAAAALGDDAGLQRAIEGGHVNDTSYDGWTPLHLSAFFGQLEAARRLQDAGAAIDAVSQNSMRNTPLHAATAGGHAAIALLLIDRGADVSSRDAGRHTPLHIAAENGLADVVRALLNRGADPFAVDAQDMTPLARAAAKNRNEIIDLLNERT